MKFRPNAEMLDDYPGAIMIVAIILMGLTSIAMAIEGLGNEENPYLIKNLSDFYTFVDSSNMTTFWKAGVFIRLDVDIDLEDKVFDKALIAPDQSSDSGYQGYGFSGDFDGNGHRIIKVTIQTGETSSDDCLGVWGQINAAGVVHDLAIQTINIAGSNNSSFVGGLCGINLGVVERCCVAGDAVRGLASIGGICGKNSGTITDCYTHSDVEGLASSNYLGGCCGTNWYGGVIENCYCTGLISGNGFRGGFCGYNLGSIVTCFWDKESSEMTMGVGKTQGGTSTISGLTCEEMAEMEHFKTAGWDFEGSPPVWIEGDYGPQLFWQVDAEDLIWEGDLELVLEQGETRLLKITLTNQAVSEIVWLLSNYKGCPWIRAINPLGGTLAAQASTDVWITIDSADLERGEYQRTLYLNFNGQSVPLDTLLTIDNRIDLEELGDLSRFWLEDDCVNTSDCAAIDWHKDGKINLIDLILLTGSWLEARPVFRLFDAFESNNLYLLNWITASDGTGWFATDEGAWRGNYCARSGLIEDGKSSRLSLTLDLTGVEVNAVGFARRVSSEPDYDWLRFYIDDSLIEQWSGLQEWKYVTYPVTPGVREFKWEYVKDEAFQGYDDAAWIDDFELYLATEE